MSPAPAPETGFSSPPSTTPLIQQARVRLQSDHHALANVSQELLLVQAEVANMEQSLFGNVLTFEAVQTLYAQHEQVEGINAKLRDDIARLTMQVDGLSVQLASAQRAYILDGKQHRATEGRLRGQVVQSRAMSESLKVEVAKGDDVERIYEALSKDRGRLLNESLRLAGEGEAALRALAATQAAAREEAGKYSTLQEEIAELHKIGAACLSSMARDEKSVAMAQVSLPKEGQAAAATERQAKAVSEAARQRLAAEGAILRQEIIKTESSGAQALGSLKELQVEFKSLEQNLVTEVHNISAKMNLTKAHSLAVGKSLADNHGVQAEDLARKHATQVRLATLQQQVSPVVYSSLHAENDAYESELRHAVELLTKSKSAEALATVAAEQLEAEVSAQRDAVESTAKALQEARIEGERQLQTAVSEASAGETEAAQVQTQAEDALTTKCSDKWEARKSEKEAETNQCKEQKAKLSIVQAQRDTLETALQAQQSADAASA